MTTKSSSARRWLAALIGLFTLGLALAAPVARAAATGAPGAPNLTQSNWDGAASYSIIMNMWWGNNGTTWQLFENGALVHSETLADNSPNAQTASFAFTNKAKGSYTYTTKLTNSFGTTAGSTLVYTVTQGSGTGPTVPGIPTGVSATAASTSQINVTWNAVSGATGYDLQRDGVVVADVTSPYAHTGLAAGSTHSYAVRAKNSAGLSAWSNLISATTPSVVTIPPVPTGLSAVANGTTQISVKWNSSSGASGYDLQVDGATVANVTSPYTHSGLAANSTHNYAVRAKNSAGQSAWSATVSGKTDANVPVGPLPKHALTGYWQNFNNGAKVLRIRDVPTTYDLIVVSFADATGTPGAITFNLDSGLSSALGGYTEAQFISDIAAVKARGQHVIISVGGQNGSISVSSSTSAGNFASSVNSLIAKYGFEGVDIDLENGVSATFMAQALRAVKSGSIITMAPQTIDMQNVNTEYFKLALAIKDILTICNMQYYNSGSMLGYDGKVYSQGGVDFLTALATIQLENGLRPDQVGLGLPASTSAAGSGYVSPSIVNQALDILARGTTGGSFHPPRTYPSLRGAMTWSINWDASNGYNFANSVSAKLKTLP
jgi:chitinase